MYIEDKIIDFIPDVSSSKSVLYAQSCISDFCQNVIYLFHNVLFILNDVTDQTKNSSIYDVSYNQTPTNCTGELSDFAIKEIQHRLDDVQAHIDDIKNGEFFCLLPNKLLHDLNDALKILMDMLMVCKNHITNAENRPVSSRLFGHLAKNNLLDLCYKCHMALKQINITIKQRNFKVKENQYVCKHFMRTGQALSLCIQGCVFLREETTENILAELLEEWAHIIMISFATLPYPMILIGLNRVSSRLGDFNESKYELYGGYGGMLQDLKKIVFLVESEKLIMPSSLATVCNQIQQRKNVSQHRIIHRYSMVEYFMIYALKTWNSINFNYREIKWNRKTYHRHVNSVIKQANLVGNMIEQWRVDNPAYLLQAGYLIKIMNNEW